MAAIAVHGFINVDLVGKTAAFAGADQEVELEEFQVFSGGSAANIATGLARLGQEVFFLGAIGDDRYGSMLKEELENVRCDYLREIPGAVSGTVMVIVDEQGLRTMYTYPGANLHYDWHQVSDEFLDQLDYLHLSSPAMSSVEQLLSLQSPTRAFKISLDPSKLMTSRGLHSLRPLLTKTEILFLNEAELHDLYPGLEREDALYELHQLGIRHLFIKLGARGAVYSQMTSDGQLRLLSHPALKVVAIDSTGAGDAFASGVLYGLSRNWTAEQVLRLGIEMGTRAVAVIGARKGLPYREQLSEMEWFA